MAQNDEKKELRYGFTTGSCAAAAAKAATIMLLSGKVKDRVSIVTPKGTVFETEILDIQRAENEVSCAVRKDAGDDPDVTDGILIYARVTYRESERVNSVNSVDNINNCDQRACGNEIDGRETEIHGCGSPVCITGGKGVGRVTLPGLDQPVGEAAINHVPREMITKEVTEVSEFFDNKLPLMIEIYAPEGDAIAEKTFNSRLGIVGGISILGTSGVVEPMSEKALVDTIHAELSVKRALGNDKVVVAPGNYGLDFIKSRYNYDLDKAVKCSNFIGDTVQMAGEMGFTSFVLAGHVGKLVKLAAGMLNTHSKYGDHRMEVIAEEAEKAGLPESYVERIKECISTDAAIDVIDEYDDIRNERQDKTNSGKETADEYKSLVDETADSGSDLVSITETGIRRIIMNNIMTRIMDTLQSVNPTGMKLYVIMFSNKAGFLAASDGAEDMIK